MKDRLLGTPPDQILESEKMRRLQDIADRHVAHLNSGTKPSVEETIEWFRKLTAFHEEEHELDRRYPDQPPE